MYSSRSRRNSVAYASPPMIHSQPIPVQPTYQNFNGYTVASSPPQGHYMGGMGGVPPSPNALHMGLSSSPSGHYPYVPPQPLMQQHQSPYSFPTTQNFNGYTMAQQPMGMTPPDHGYSEYGHMPMTPAATYGRRARSVSNLPGSY